MTTGEALTTLRVRAGLCKTQVARHVGVSVHRITRLERDLERWDAHLGQRMLTVLLAMTDPAAASLLSATVRAAEGGDIYGVPVILQ